jgi:hypothetical protein
MQEKLIVRKLLQEMRRLRVEFSTSVVLEFVYNLCMMSNSLSEVKLFRTGFLSNTADLVSDRPYDMRKLG